MNFNIQCSRHDIFYTQTENTANML